LYKEAPVSIAWWWLALAGFGLFLFCAIAQERIKTGSEIAYSLLYDGALMGFLMVPTGLALTAHQYLQDFSWYQVFLRLLEILGAIGLAMLLIGTLSISIRSKNLVGKKPLTTYMPFNLVYVESIEPHISDAPPRAPRNYVICVDGTWDNPDSNTNVHRFWKYLIQEPEQQIAKYYIGVGVKENTEEERRAFGAATRKMLIGCGTGLGARIVRSKAFVDFVRLV
jgi:hypothetical protein